MTLFELMFGLSAVVLGLALTHLATGVHRLAMAGNRVRWAPEPVLLAAIIFLVIVSVWLFQWPLRDRPSLTVGLVILQVLKFLSPYLAAAFVLPETVPTKGGIDLYAHYDRTRAFTFGALIAGLLLFWVQGLLLESTSPGAPPVTVGRVLETAPWIYVPTYLLLIFVRIRWLNILCLAGVLVLYGWQIVGIELRT